MATEKQLKAVINEMPDWRKRKLGAALLVIIQLQRQQGSRPVEPGESGTTKNQPNTAVQTGRLFRGQAATEPEFSIGAKKCMAFRAN